MQRVISQQTYSDMPMNASISQPVCITLSGTYSQGIFFTNTTTIGTQYPITNMTTWNNATHNYKGTNGNTWYNVTACAGNAINVKVAHCACSDLVCQSGSCTPGTDLLYVTDSGGLGAVGWANHTTASSVPHLPVYNFSGTDIYQQISPSLAASSTIHIRYWIDPRPNNAPSGVYRANYTIQAVEEKSNFGTCTCD